MTSKTEGGGTSFFSAGAGDGTHPIQLTPLESLYLSDSLSMYMQGPPDALSEQGSPYPTLLLKIGGAVLETEEHKALATVSLLLHEFWMLREVVKSSVVVGSERVGLNLLLKIYTGIRFLSAEDDVQSAVSALGEVTEDEPGKDDYAAQLQRIRDGSNLNLGGENDG